jgi:hypothetical protein
MEKLVVNLRTNKLSIRDSHIRLHDSVIDATQDKHAVNIKYDARCSAENSPIHDDVEKLEKALGEEFITEHIDISIPTDEQAHYMHIKGDFDAYIYRR